jgi:hypothetical protein
VQHTSRTARFLQQFAHPNHPRMSVPVRIKSQSLGHRGDAFRDVEVVDDPNPLQSSPRFGGVTHSSQNLAVVLRLRVSRVGHVAQARQRSVPFGQSPTNQAGQLIRERCLMRLRWLSQVNGSQSSAVAIVDEIVAVEPTSYTPCTWNVTPSLPTAKTGLFRPDEA